MNISYYILKKIKNRNDRYLKFEDRIFRFDEIASNILKAATFLKQQGVKKGDRVALKLNKSMEFIYLHFANMLIGAVTLPLNPNYSVSETAYFLEDAQAALFISDKENISSLTKTLIEFNIKPFDIKNLKLDEFEEHPLIDLTKPSNTAIIAYTSGTTGKSKGAMITHKNLITNMEALKELWLLSQNDKLLHVLPIFHVHGLVVALQGALNACMDIVMHGKFDALRTIETIKHEKITLFMGVPTIYNRLTQALQNLNGKTNFQSMRLFISGSAPLTEVVFNRFYNLTNHKILERYGMSEAGMIASNPYEEDKRIPLSVGYPIGDCKIKISKDSKEMPPNTVGEVYIKGSNVFKGYFRKPDKTRESFENGWFKTGDMGYLDNSGRLYLVGRAKELIITGGFNVYPKEVENVIDNMDCVVESAVFGVKDEDFGERVEAAVVLKDSCKLNEEVIIQECKKQLAPYKCPKRVHFLKELPKNAMGKIQKNILSKQFSN
ncbi:AMP-binding protein [Hippea jasoniae]|uniref:AMP-binding protein n=1 Tax=Hippea jasoniae TaxID=944479 RepID=UPI00068A6782|nr:AMP-binding protein [Hippea jasoniae]